MKKLYYMTCVVLLSAVLLPWQSLAQKADAMIIWNGFYWGENSITCFIAPPSIEEDGAGGYRFTYALKKGDKTLYEGTAFIQSDGESDLFNPQLEHGSPLLVAQCEKGFLQFMLSPELPRNIDVPTVLVLKKGPNAEDFILNIRMVIGTYTSGVG